MKQTELEKLIESKVRKALKEGRDVKKILASYLEHYEYENFEKYAKQIISFIGYENLTELEIKKFLCDMIMNMKIKQ